MYCLNLIFREVKDALIDGLSKIEDTQNLDITRAVMDETLRLYKIGSFSERQAETDIEIDGFLIPQGTQVINALCLTLDDTNAFPSPETFDIENVRSVKKVSPEVQTI